MSDDLIPCLRAHSRTLCDKLVEQFRDSQRGYSEADLQSASEKMRDSRPGEWIEVTAREFKAIRSRTMDSGGGTLPP